MSGIAESFKRCRGCESVLLVTDVNWYFCNDKPKSQCKECQKKQDVIRRQTEHYREQDRKRNQDPCRKERMRAGNALRAAVKKGTVVKVTSCQFCQSLKDVTGHHHRGYQRKHWLHVVWLCRRCHRLVHEMMQDGVPVRKATSAVERMVRREQTAMRFN